MVIEVTFDVTDVYISTTVSPVYVNVSFEAPTGGGGAVWGDITGTLSNQTDLQSALDGKFDDPTGTSLQYIDGTGALQTFPLTLPVLQQVRNQTGGTLAVGTVVYISGATGNLPTVTKAIATGDATSAQTLGMVSAAIANNGVGYVVVIGTCSGLDTSAYTEGQQLYLSYTTAGAVTTTKPYAPYHLVYIGIVTRAHPTLGTVEVRVQNGYELDEIHDVDALNPDNNDGIFYNSTTSLWEHKQISTALGYTPANSATTLTINGVTYDLSANRSWTISAGISGSGASGQVAYWDGTSSISGENNLFWDAANNRLGVVTNTPRGSLDVIGNFYLGSNTLFQDAGASTVINQTAYYPIILRTNNAERVRVFETGNFGIGTGSTDGGQRLQVQGTTLLNGNVTFSSSTGMTWDATNSRLGIGTNSPNANAVVHLNKSQDGGTALFVSNNNTGSGALSSIRAGLNPTNYAVDYITLTILGTNFGTSGNLKAKTGFLENYGSNFIISNYNDSEPIIFATGTSRVAKMQLFAGGNLALQNGGTFTDTGERLQVTGDVKITGNVAVDTNVLFVDTANDRVGIGTALPSVLLHSSGVDGSNTNVFRLTNTANLGTTAWANTVSHDIQFHYTDGSFGPVVYGSIRAVGNPNSGAINAGTIDTDLSFLTAGYDVGGGLTEKFRIKATGQIRFVPRATAPNGAQAGDVYYNSTDNKHYGYNGTTWNAFY
jgi:hypothetical protein